MTESFLHFVWERQYFNKESLYTTSGESIKIHHPGQLNTHAGPDFFSARLRIGTVEWIGNVEVHISSSGWHDHQHSTDDAYNNVILHVVWKDNRPVQLNDGSWLPTLELQSRVDRDLLTRYRALVGSIESIPCTGGLTKVRNETRQLALERALGERLTQKAQWILQAVSRNRGDWEETTYQVLARSFGFKVNAEPFLQLAQSLPLKMVLKHATQTLQLEAMLFGQAGFLDTMSDDPYYLQLQREYRLLGRKYDLYRMRLSRAQWRFLRMRPANFPTIRIAQFASIYHCNPNIFSALLHADSRRDAAAIFSVSTSDYWRYHYQFFGNWTPHLSKMGTSSIDSLITNTLVPLLTAYGHYKKDQVFIDRAVRILQTMPAEINYVIRHWVERGWVATTAAESQAMLELFRNYCSKRRCLQCVVGREIINPISS